MRTRQVSHISLDKSTVLVPGNFPRSDYTVLLKIPGEDVGRILNNRAELQTALLRKFVEGDLQERKKDGG